MDFKINDLVIHLHEDTEAAIPCPPTATCFNTIPEAKLITEVLGADSASAKKIFEMIEERIIKDPSQEDLKMLANILQETLDAVKSKIG